MAVDVPIREAARLATIPGFSSSIDAISDIMLLQITKNGGFADDRVRLAAHHAINKEAISKAFYNGAAKPISVPGGAQHARLSRGLHVPVLGGEGDRAAEGGGLRPANPLKIKFSSPNGAFPGDFDVARAIVQMWKKVGIDAELETVELSTYQERLRAGTLPEATLFSWGNAAGDPEMYGGYLLDPKSIFSAFKTDDLAPKFQPLLVETDEKKRLEGYKAAHRYAAEKGYTIPLVQTVKTLVHQNNVVVVKYDNGLVLPQT